MRAPRGSRLSAVGAALLLSATLSGCVESSLVAQARGDLEGGIPGAAFEKQHALHFGRLTTALLKPVAMWALRGDDDLDSLRHIRRIDVAVYEVTSFPEEIDVEMLSDLERRLSRSGWGRVVRSREEDEVTWVFNRENKSGGVKDLFVVTIDGAEMVMVRVGGRLDELLVEMIADDPGGFGASLGG